MEYSGLSISDAISAMTAPAARRYALNSSGWQAFIAIAVDSSSRASVSIISSLIFFAITGSLIIVLGTPLAPCIDLRSSRIANRDLRNPAAEHLFYPLLLLGAAHNFNYSYSLARGLILGSYPSARATSDDFYRC